MSMDTAPYKNRIELLQGTLDMLILKTLQWGPQHGYGIVQALRLQSGEVLQAMETGSLTLPCIGWNDRSWVRLSMEAVREQTTSPLLPDHATREEATRFRSKPLGTDRRSNQLSNARLSGGGQSVNRRWRIGPWRLKNDLREEIEAHLKMSFADHIARGESEEEARQAAMREFGNVPLVQEVTREMWSWMWLDYLAQKCPICAAVPPPLTRFFRGRDNDYRSRNWRDQRHLQRRVRSRPAALCHLLALDQLVAVSAKPLPWLSVPTIKDWQQGSRAFPIDSRLWRVVSPH